MKLTAAKVHRSGKTAKMWNYETDKVELVEKKAEAISLTFCLSSKGGGITEVKLSIGADDFAPLVSAMISADRGRAMGDMALAIATEIANQSDYDKELTREARESVAQAADYAYSEAPPSHNHAERLVRDVTRQLVEELNNADDKAGVSSEQHSLVPHKG